MRRIIAGLFQSVDNVVQAPGGPDEDRTGGFDLGGWAASYFDEALGGFLDEQFTGPEFDLLLGRRTYEIFAAHWPAMLDDPMGARFDRITKYVVTSDPALLTWRNSEALVGDPAETIGALREGDGPDLLIQGSSELYPALLGAGLIDRLFLITMPIILGRGKRAFGDAAFPAGLTLVDHRVGTTGVTMAMYERAGAVPTGSFELDTPTDAELARRKKWAAEEA